MDWVFISIASAAVSALVNISDKTVLHRYARSPLTLPLFIGLAQTTIGIVILSLTGIPVNSTLSASSFATVSGLLFGLSGVISQRVLFTQEVSRTIPVTQAAPIFAAMLSLFILNESISFLQWAGITATVVGSILISLRLGSAIERIFLHKSFYLLILSAFLFGATTVIGKLSLDELPLLYTHGVRTLALGIVFLAFSLRSEPLTEIGEYLSEKSPVLLIVSINEFITANLGTLLFLWALSEGPASLVTAAVGTRALFVVLFSIGISIMWNGALGEQMSAKTILIKIISTMLIVSGVAAVAF